jgi:hypothetical protein
LRYGQTRKRKYAYHVEKNGNEDENRMQKVHGKTDENGTESENVKEDARASESYPTGYHTTSRIPSPTPTLGLRPWEFLQSSLVSGR